MKQILIAILLFILGAITALILRDWYILTIVSGICAIIVAIKLDKLTMNDTVKYQCPSCGDIIIMHKSIANKFIKNNTPYECEYCGKLIIIE